MDNDKEFESLVEAAHNAWLREKQSRGVTSWPNEHGVEQMVPYSELGEDVREFDRVVVRAILFRIFTLSIDRANRERKPPVDPDDGDAY